ncbi:unnamed protein product [Nesidiocoris tenuis]|uniref:Uncharacterized protein n=1 Tax=Nesidiocoris tenuis TaxID=355587 RepID=A0A6H5H4M1_9HEMI|nr:unnamed protein product [Nesidiocoris tenuis]
MTTLRRERRLLSIAYKRLIFYTKEGRQPQAFNRRLHQPLYANFLTGPPPTHSILGLPSRRNMHRNSRDFYPLLFIFILFSNTIMPTSPISLSISTFLIIRLDTAVE